MKILALLLMAASTSFGLDISGIWRLTRATADVASFPIAVQIEQCGSDLLVLKVMATPQGRHIEQLWLHAATIHVLTKAVEITVASETWTIGARGELTIHEASGQRIVLEPAEGGLE